MYGGTYFGEVQFGATSSGDKLVGVSDSLSISESVQATFISTISISETIGITESNNLNFLSFPDYNVLIQDSLIVEENTRTRRLLSTNWTNLPIEGRDNWQPLDDD